MPPKAQPDVAVVIAYFNGMNTDQKRVPQITRLIFWLNSPFAITC